MISNVFKSRATSYLQVTSHENKYCLWKRWAGFVTSMKMYKDFRKTIFNRLNPISSVVDSFLARKTLTSQLSLKKTKSPHSIRNWKIVSLTRQSFLCWTRLILVILKWPLFGQDKLWILWYICTKMTRIFLNKIYQVNKIVHLYKPKSIVLMTPLMSQPMIAK